MSNFKSGSGNLDFGGEDDEEEEESDTPQQMADTTDTDTDATAESPSTEESSPAPPAESSPKCDRSTAVSSSAGSSTTEQPTSRSSTHEHQYPYFVRRNNVGDERDTRLELHVRDEVAAREARFRSAVAEHLGTGNVSKTDAREFALLLAYEHPEKVAELMREEGFGALD